MTPKEQEEFTNWLRLMHAQLAHQGDGREYKLQQMVDGRWTDNGAAQSTVVCDLAVRRLMLGGARARALPLKP